VLAEGERGREEQLALEVQAFAELCTPSRSQSVQSLSPGVKAAGARRLFMVALKLV
jgi:hypothetical protein